MQSSIYIYLLKSVHTTIAMYSIKAMNYNKEPKDVTATYQFFYGILRGILVNVSVNNVNRVNIQLLQGIGNRTKTL